MWTRRWMWIAWPAFLAAGMVETLVFAVFDPQDMMWLGQQIELSRMAIYTLSFFALWAVFLMAGFLTIVLSMSSAETNARPQAPAGTVLDWRLQESIEACYPNNP